MKHLLVAVLLIASIPYHSQSQKGDPTRDISISSGFLTGNEYLDMSTTKKRGYAMGMINGMLMAQLFGASERNVAWLRSCTDSMDDEQVVAIFGKYLFDNPGRRHHRMNILSYNAMREVCK